MCHLWLQVLPVNFDPAQGDPRMAVQEALVRHNVELAGQDDFSGAAEQFRRALQLQPQDANVEANLGADLAQLGQFAEAKSHFEHALQMDPNQAIAREDLEALQKETGAH